MSFVDILSRGVAIAVLAFAATFLLLTLLSYFTSDLSPFRQSLLIALFASLGAALPLIAIQVIRSSRGGAPPADGGALMFKIYAALAGALAVLLIVAAMSGQLRL